MTETKAVVATKPTKQDEFLAALIESIGCSMPVAILVFRYTFDATDRATMSGFWNSGPRSGSHYLGHESWVEFRRKHDLDQQIEDVNDHINHPDWNLKLHRLMYGAVYWGWGELIRAKRVSGRQSFVTYLDLRCKHQPQLIKPGY